MNEGHSETLQDHQEKIQKLTKENHDREMLVDEMHRRLERLEARINNNEREIENLHQGARKYY